MSPYVPSFDLATWALLGIVYSLLAYVLWSSFPNDDDE